MNHLYILETGMKLLKVTYTAFSGFFFLYFQQKCCGQRPLSWEGGITTTP